MDKADLRYFLLLNFAMLFISTSGVLASSLYMYPPVSVWFRCLIAAAVLGVYCYFKGFPVALKEGRGQRSVFISGVLMSAHWVFYFFALVYTNVAVAMLSIFTYPMMTTLLEPIFLKEKLEIRSILLSGLILLGIYLLLPSLSIDNSDTIGLLFAILSALTYSFRNLLMKKEIEHYNGSVLMLYQCLVSLLVLIPFFFFAPPSFDEIAHDIPFLLGLGVITTCIGHTIFLHTFSHFKISTTSILSGFQPVFGIGLAVIFLHEYPSGRTILGGFIILLTVLIESVLASRNKSKISNV